MFKYLINFFFSTTNSTDDYFIKQYESKVKKMDEKNKKNKEKRIIEREVRKSQRFTLR